MAASSPSFDVIVVGGGIAGSTLGGVLARAGRSLVERELSTERIAAETAAVYRSLLER